MGSSLFQERRREIRLKRSGFEMTRMQDNSPDQAITYKLATTQEELESAFRLVYRAYVAVGLQQEDEVGLRFSKYHLLPSTKVLIATYHPQLQQEHPDYRQIGKDRKIVGTLTLVVDSGMGLPMAEVCGSTVCNFRKAGRYPAEVIALAAHPRFRGINTIMRLFRLMVGYARLNDVTDLGAAVTPRHTKFYQDMLLFKPFGQKAAYSRANGLETQCHFLDMAVAEDAYQHVYGTQEFDCNLAEFFRRGDTLEENQNHRLLSDDVLRYLLTLKGPDALGITHQDLQVLRAAYAARDRTFPL